jgi:Arylsulfotransferase (ASST)
MVPGERRLTRAGFLVASAAGIGAVAVPGARGATPAPEGTSDTVRQFVSRPDLRPPVVDVVTALPTSSPGYVFVAPASGDSQLGPLIVDETGQPVWFHPLPLESGKAAHNFRVQTYEGKPVLTWWEGVYADGYGQGEYVIMGPEYEEITRVQAGNGLSGDLHEFLITDRGTALISAYNGVPTDLSPYGGPVDGTLLEGVVQEVHIESGAVLFEWHSSDHVTIDESYLPNTAGIWDYFHLNSIDDVDDGTVVISARHTSTIYKLDRTTGDIVWRLGGKKSDFAMGDGTAFAYQHDARDHGNGVVSVFDDGSYSAESAIETASRAIVLQLDTGAMTASLARAEANPEGALSYAMGNTQLLDDGGMFVGWGTTPECSEYAADGTLRFDATLAGGAISYRAFRLPWSGRQTAPPALATRANADGSVDLFMSWNGTTDISHWQVLGGEERSRLEPLRTAPHTGFETSIRLPKPPPYLSAVALDQRSRTLAASHVIRS